jgi:nitric oxide reductase subunit C
MGCHTILGEGAYYAPELTKVVERRGEGYIKAVLMSKTSWAPRGRRMVAYGFSEEQANDLVAFFTWIGNTDLNGFPPKPDYKSTINSK